MPPRPRSMVKLVWAAALVLLIAVALVVGLLIGRADEKPVKKVVLISIDTLRADHLGYAGYHRETSPAIDRLAAESLDFRNTFAQASATLSSHASIFTSLYPSVHNAEMLRATPLADGFTTLAEVFREHGFRTAAFV